MNAIVGFIMLEKLRHAFQMSIIDCVEREIHLAGNGILSDKLGTISCALASEWTDFAIPCVSGL